jgi:hypothetical protein
MRGVESCPQSIREQTCGAVHNRHVLIIGYRLNSFTTTYNITGAMTVILIIMLMTLLNAVMNKIETKLLRWRPPTNTTEAMELR